MKLECSIEKLRNGILQAERITGKNLTLPVLSSILLIAEGKSLKLRATNLSLGIEIDIPAKIETEGIVAISGTVLANTFSNINQNENVQLESMEGNLIVRARKSQIRLKGSPHEDFPTIPKVEGESFEIDTKKILDGIKSVYYSASVSDIKQEISSVYVYTNEENLVFVSTDSFRLAEKKIKVKNTPAISGILIPFKNVPEIIRSLTEAETVARVEVSKNQISFSFNATYLTSRIIDGVFPDYRQIIPKEFKTEITMLKQDLLNALKLSNIFSDKFNQLNLTVSVKDKFCELSSSNHDVGENKTSLDAVLKGSDISLAFNYKYFLDCFSSITTDSLSIKCVDAGRPMVVTPVSDSSFTYLIMPMNR